MPFGLFGVLLYPIGIPVFVYVSLYVNVAYLHHDVKSIEDELEDAAGREDLLVQVIEKMDGQPDNQIVLACLRASADVQILDAELEQVSSTCSLFNHLKETVQVRSRLLEHQVVRFRYGFMYLQYSNHAWYWEQVLMLHKFCLTSVILFIKPG